MRVDRKAGHLRQEERYNMFQLLHTIFRFCTYKKTFIFYLGLLYIIIYIFYYYTLYENILYYYNYLISSFIPSYYYCFLS